MFYSSIKESSEQIADDRKRLKNEQKSSIVPRMALS